ncbi:MAG: hypothetical protein QXI12_01160 [Candidatus Methanomethyliaceae archaeon]
MPKALGRLLVTRGVFPEFPRALLRSDGFAPSFQSAVESLTTTVENALKQIVPASLVHKLVGASGQYEPDVCRTIELIVQPGWVCADVGAHIGIITKVLAKCWWVPEAWWSPFKHIPGTQKGYGKT